MVPGLGVMVCSAWLVVMMSARVTYDGVSTKLSFGVSNPPELGVSTRVSCDDMSTWVSCDLSTQVSCGVSPGLAVMCHPG